MRIVIADDSGLLCQTADGTDANPVKIQLGGFTLVKVAVAGVDNQNDVGDLVYASDDGLRPTPTALPPGVTLTVDQIKGSMTLRQVSEQTGVPLGAILEALKLPADAGVDTAHKDLISAGKLTEVTQVRDAVTRLLGK